MTTTETLAPGTIAQYRKVGKVRILALLDAPAGNSTVYRYSVKFITGPRNYRELEDAAVWLDLSAAVPA